MRKIISFVVVTIFIAGCIATVPNSVSDDMLSAYAPPQMDVRVNPDIEFTPRVRHALKEYIDEQMTTAERERLIAFSGTSEPAPSDLLAYAVASSVTANLDGGFTGTRPARLEIAISDAVFPNIEGSNRVWMVRQIDYGFTLYDMACDTSLVTARGPIEAGAHTEEYAGLLGLVPGSSSSDFVTDVLLLAGTVGTSINQFILEREVPETQLSFYDTNPVQTGMACN